MATFDDVRAIAMALPEAEEIVTWEVDITFRVRGKIFVIGGDGSDSVSIKATPMTQADLIDRDPETFRPSAYVGRAPWVAHRGGVADDRTEATGGGPWLARAVLGGALTRPDRPDARRHRDQ